MRDDTRYSRKARDILENIGENLGSFVASILEHPKVFLGIPAALVMVWLGRESDEDLARKPALVDQIVAEVEARCTTQAKIPDLKAKVGAAVSNIRYVATDQYIKHNITLCPSQAVTEFRARAGNDIILPSQFVAAYYFNDGKPVMAIGDKGDRKKALETFASKFLTSAEPPHLNMLAYEQSETYRCGKDSQGRTDYCTRHWVEWAPADRFSKELEKRPTLASAPLKEGAPHLDYKAW